MAWYDQYPQSPGSQQQGMSPQQMIQFGMGLTQPRQPAPPPPFGGGGQEPPDPLDAYSDDDIARAYAKRQSRSGARIGGKSYGP